mgnify:CR=1 FL=1
MRKTLSFGVGGTDGDWVDPWPDRVGPDCVGPGWSGWTGFDWAGFGGGDDAINDGEVITLATGGFGGVFSTSGDPVSSSIASIASKRIYVYNSYVFLENKT